MATKKKMKKAKATKKATKKASAKKMVAKKATTKKSAKAATAKKATKKKVVAKNTAKKAAKTPKAKAAPKSAKVDSKASFAQESNLSSALLRTEDPRSGAPIATPPKSGDILDETESLEELEERERAGGDAWSSEEEDTWAMDQEDETIENELSFDDED